MDRNKKYWKPKSNLWFFLAVTALAAALATDVLVPNVQETDTLYYQAVLAASIAVLLILFGIPVFSSGLGGRLYHYSQFIAAAGLFLTFLDLLTTKSNILKLPFFPGPARIVEVLFTERGMLLVCTAHSLRLFFAGLAGGVVLGIVTGVLTGWNRQWNYWLFPVIKVAGVIPPVAWIPLALVVFPSSFYAGIFLLTVASWFTIAFMVSTGIASTPKEYFEASRTLGADERYLLFHVAIPNAAPNIFTGIVTSAGMCFMMLVITEMIGAKAGLGWYINWAKAWASYDKVYASIVIMGVAFCIILAVINVFRSYFLRWQRGIVQ
ncbi:MAG: ABC transporter permease subunit [Prevotellaceae bacterium]|jgi:NitT/TauT family transport system permease protein|nr:ABC transporter permease subunit [Prevotellaceae bacterium]